MTGNHTPTLYPRPRFYLTLKDMSVIAAHPYRLFPTVFSVIPNECEESFRLLKGLLP